MSDDVVSMKEATSTDAELVLSLLKKISQETPVVMIPHLQELSVEDEQTSLAEINDRDDCLVLMACLGEQPVGILTITRISGTNPIGELGVAVLKKYWHNGIATMLVDEGEYWFNHYSSLTKLVLDVFEDNRRALEIYERLNFIRTGSKVEKDSQNKLRQAILMEYEKEE